MSFGQPACAAQHGPAASVRASGDPNHGRVELASPSNDTSRGQSRPSKRKIDDISDSGGRGSDRPTRPSPKTPRPPGGLEVGWLVSVGLAAWARDKSGEEGSKSGEGASSSEGAPASPAGLPRRPHKRHRSCRDSPPAKSAESGSGSDSGGSTKEEEGEEEASRLLACPFYRHDPAKHRSCMGLSELTDPDAVRYHVLSRHRKPLHCPRCHAVFVKHADRDRHIVHRACGPRREPRAEVLVGISAAQAVELAACDGSPAGAAAARTAEMQTCRWYQIWDVLFPGQPRPEPASVFVAGGRESAAVELRRFWSRKGAAVIAEALGVPQAKREQRATPLVALQARVIEQMLASLDREVPTDKGPN